MRFVLLLTIVCTAAPNDPLWPGARFTEADRTRAIQRGLAFIDRTARDRRNFEEYGPDYLWCFYEIASTSADPRLRSEALKIGRARARQWMRRHRHVDPKISANDLTDLVFGSLASERLGFPDAHLKQEIRDAAARIPPADFLGFDPATGPSHTDPNLLDLLCDALITTYTADQYGVTLGAPYHDAVRWLPLARPYREAAAIPLVNLVTHVVYTTNDYNARNVNPSQLPDEFAFLKSHVLDAAILADGELLGEFMDTLRAFGLTPRDAPIQRGFSELLAKQNPDGSWGDPNDRDIYDRYHPTWTAIDALREYRWK